MQEGLTELEKWEGGCKGILELSVDPVNLSHSPFISYSGEGAKLANLGRGGWLQFQCETSGQRVLLREEGT